jgi:hypothetical protein
MVLKPCLWAADSLLSLLEQHGYGCGVLQNAAGIGGGGAGNGDAVTLRG